MNSRFPRLSFAQAELILKKRVNFTLEDLASLSMPDLNGERFAPTGPPKVEASTLEDLRTDLREIANKAGYPKRSESAFREFDNRSAMLLQDFGMPLGQSLRADVWAWIAVHVVPHLVEWRWGKSDKPASIKRYAGILQRNAVGRLWYRAHVMAGEQVNDKWSALRLVNEDAHVQVLERTSVAKDRRLARLLVERWTKLGGGEEVLRNAIIRIRVRAQLVEMSLLSEPELQELIDSSFTAAKRYVEEAKAA